MTTVVEIHERVLTDETPDEEGISNAQMVGFCLRYLPATVGENGKPLPITDLDLTNLYRYEQVYVQMPKGNRLLAFVYLARLQLEFFTDLEEHTLGDNKSNMMMINYCAKWEQQLDDLLFAQHTNEPVEHLWLN